MRLRLRSRPARRFAPDLCAGILPPRITPDAGPSPLVGVGPITADPSTLPAGDTLLNPVGTPDTIVVPDLSDPNPPPDLNLVPEPADWSEWNPTGVSFA